MTPSRNDDLQDGVLWIASTASLRDSWVSGGLLLGGAMMKVGGGQNVDGLGAGL